MLYSARCARRRAGKCKRVCRVSSAGRKFAACVLASHRFFCVCILFRSPSDRSRIVLGSFFAVEQVIARVRELVAGIWEEAKVEMYGSCFTGANERQNARKRAN